MSQDFCNIDYRDNKLDCKFIETQEQLNEIYIEIDNCNSPIAIDLEFKRVSTYRPIPCLIQLAYFLDGIKCIRAIDLLAEIDSYLLVVKLCDVKLNKIFHSMNQDIECISVIADRMPNNVDDMQIMMAFQSTEDQVSYSDMVKLILDIELDKTECVSDWSHRPLSRKQLEYAMKDVEYLLDIHSIILNIIPDDKLKWYRQEIDDHLTLLSRNIWLDKTLNKAVNSEKDQIYIESNYAIIKWREQEAIYRNIPRQRIFTDLQIKEFIKLIVKNDKNILEKIKELLSSERKQYRNYHCKPRQNNYMKKDEELDSLSTSKRLSIFIEGLNESFNDSYKRSRKIKCLPLSNKTMYKNDLINHLISLREDISQMHQISTRLLATSEQLKRCTYGIENVKEILPNWRYEIFGKVVERLVEIIENITLTI